MTNINIYKSHIQAFFTSYHHFPNIGISNFVTLKMYIKVTKYNIRNGTNWWQIHDFLFDGNSNICYISHHLQYLQIKRIQKYDLEKDGHRVIEEKNGTCAIKMENGRFHIWDFLSEFYLPGKLETYVCANLDTHRHILSHTQKRGRGPWQKAKICNAWQICLKIYHHGISGIVLDWILNYLANCIQFVS